MASKIVVVGSLNADLVLAVPRFPTPGETLSADSFSRFPGGKGANQAYGAAKLGGDVCLVGQVGDDDNADWLRAGLASASVDIRYVRTAPSQPTGVAVISVERSGQNQIVVAPGANGSFGPAELAQHAGAAFASAKVVLLQLEIPLATVEAAARLARHHGARVILDPSPARELSNALLENIDYLTPNESELCLLTGASSTAGLSLFEAEVRARSLVERGARRVLVKMAARGALLVTRDGARSFATPCVQAVDTTAAGDAFNAGLAYGLARGLDEARAIELSCAAGAFTVTGRGAQPSMPSLQDVMNLLPSPLTSATTEAVW
jgi:ribokinase